MRENTLKTAWKAGRPALGLWLSTTDPVGAEQLGTLEYDYLNIDLQHGLIDYIGAVSLLQAIAGSAAAPLCRVPWNEPGIIGKVLDAGAMGVIIPMVNTRAEAEAAVRACRYAPAGARSFGPARAGMALGPGYYPAANDEIACIPMIETVEALQQPRRHPRRPGDPTPSTSARPTSASASGLPSGGRQRRTRASSTPSTPSVVEPRPEAGHRRRHPLLARGGG